MDTYSTLFGKIPPQARDLEEAILGALMLEKDAIIDVMPILEPEYFYVDAHQVIYLAILDLFNLGSVIDILTVTEHLRKKEQLEAIGGAFYITELTDKIASSANIIHHVRVINEKYLKRNCITKMTESIRDAYDDSKDVFELIESVEQNIFKMTSKIQKSKPVLRIGEIMQQTVEHLEVVSQKNDVTGIRSGFKDLDDVTGGYLDGDLIVIGARPGMGKSAFILQVADYMAKDYPVALFNLEMSNLKTGKRILSQRKGVDSNIIQKGKYKNWKELNILLDEIYDHKLFIDDSAGLTIFEFRSKLKKLILEHGIKIAMVDYLQLMRGEKGGNRETEISSIARGLKITAKDFNIPIIALSQLSRKVEERAGKVPQLSDLRESGSLEQDSDVVQFIYRPAYYGIDGLMDKKTNQTLPNNIAKIITEKNRNGSLDDVNLLWDGPTTSFKSYDPF